jgi:amino acid adenylation domain-containing protein
MPTDRPHRTNQDFRTGTVRCELPTELAHRLRALTDRTGGTLLSTALAGLQAVLARHTREQDFLVGTVVSRPGRAPIGRVDTLVPIRADLHGHPTVTELLTRVRDACAEAVEHRDFPFDLLAGKLAAGQHPGRLPLVQVSCAVREPWAGPIDAAGVTVELVEGGEDTTGFELAASMVDDGTDLLLHMTYHVAVHDEYSVRRLVGHWRTTLAGMADDEHARVTDLPMLSEAERQQVVVEFNRTAVDVTGDQDVQRAVARHAAATPDAVAVECTGVTMTYRELDTRIDALAELLLARGVEPDTRVGILLEPSIEFVVCVLAVLRAGGASVPLDTDSPPHRLALMVHDSATALVLTDHALAPQLADEDTDLVCLDDLDLAAPSGPVVVPTPNSALAYVIFTSGSTGRPQGVGVTRRNLANYLAWVRSTLVPDPTQLVPVISRLTFDGAIKQLFTPLLAGERAWLLPRDVLRDPAELSRQLAARESVVVGCTPSLCEAILEFGDPSVHAALARSWSRVLLGGEPLDRALVERMRRTYPDTQVWNVYGPTETTANSSVARVDQIDRPYGTAPIGGPVWNCTYYVLDDDMRPVPVGVPGELHIGGAPVARGYVGRSDLTADRFVPDPFGDTPGARLYRTGDIARWLPTGALEFVGRKDFQVKIRGMRIEPGEVSSALREHPGVAEAVVTVRSDGPSGGGQQLVAYVRPGPGGVTNDEIRSFLRERVPDYLMPAATVLLDEFPHLSNGKVDRGSLPAPVWTVAGEGRIAPRTGGERALADVWEQVLGVPDIGIHDNFFELGGHSLLAARVAARIATDFGVSLPVRTIFGAPTVATLFPVIVRHRAADVGGAALERALAELGRQRAQSSCTPHRGTELLDHTEEPNNSSPENGNRASTKSYPTADRTVKKTRPGRIPENISNAHRGCPGGKPVAPPDAEPVRRRARRRGRGRRAAHTGSARTRQLPAHPAA